MFNTDMELIKKRRSVRTFDRKEISAEDRESLQKFIDGITNPYNIPIEFRFLDAKEHGLTSPVLSGESLYIGAKVKKAPHAEEAYGYAFEALVLYAISIDIGTVWIGGTMNRGAFETAMELKEGEIMPCVTPIGYIAKKMSVKETLMRKGVKADTRKPFAELFYDGDFRTPLTEEKAGKLYEPLEMVRWAPSAVNIQPWRIVVDGNEVHFYEKKTKGYIHDATGDLQKIDVGIAMCHFEYGLKNSGIDAEFIISDPGIAVEQDTEYIATYRFSLG